MDWMYVVFAVVVVGLIALDLSVHRGGKEISLKSATIWSVFYIFSALCFSAYIAATHSTNDAQLFLTGYALEKILAVDNLFAFMLVFGYFGIASKYQHNILYWGIIGAIVFRAIFVLLGTGFSAVFGPWASLVFAAIIVWTAIKMWTNEENDDGEEVDYSNKWYVTFLKKFVPVTDKADGGKFFVKLLDENGVMKTFATPLLLCLISIEISDVIFSFDSVPAVLSVTPDPFLAFSAMIFAVLGLRSLYFVLEAMKKMLSRLEQAVIIILLFIGGKLVIESGSNLAEYYGIAGITEVHIDPFISLGVIVSLLIAGVMASVAFPKQEA